MTMLILKYRLKPGIAADAFEEWVHTVDQPTMRGLKRVKSFDTFRIESLLMGEGSPSCDYVEVFEIDDFAGFAQEDLGGATVQSIMGQFMGFADAPEFMIARKL